METAEEFVRRLHECVRIAPPDNAYFAPDETQRRVEARDAAVALAAKRAVLTEAMNEGKRRHLANGGGSVGHTYDVVCELLAKYTQPIQSSEGSGGQ